MAALEDVTMTTSSATSNDNSIKIDDIFTPVNYERFLLEFVSDDF